MTKTTSALAILGFLLSTAGFSLAGAVDGPGHGLPVSAPGESAKQPVGEPVDPVAAVEDALSSILGGDLAASSVPPFPVTDTRALYATNGNKAVLDSHGTTHVVYTDDDAVYYRSTDDWANPVIISSPSCGRCVHPTIGIDTATDDLAVAFVRDTGAADDIGPLDYSYKTAGGGAFAAPVEVSSWALGTTPSLVVFEGDVHVAWRGESVYVVYYSTFAATAPPATFSVDYASDLCLCLNVNNYEYAFPSIAVARDASNQLDVLVAAATFCDCNYASPFEYVVGVQVLEGNGASYWPAVFSETRSSFAWPSHDLFAASLAATGAGEFLVAWSDSMNGAPETHLARRDASDVWASSVQTIASTGGQVDVVARATAGGSVLRVVWNEGGFGSGTTWLRNGLWTTGGFVWTGNYATKLADDGVDAQAYFRPPIYVVHQFYVDCPPYTLWEEPDGAGHVIKLWPADDCMEAALSELVPSSA